MKIPYSKFTMYVQLCKVEVAKITYSLFFIIQFYFSE